MTVCHLNSSSPGSRKTWRLFIAVNGEKSAFQIKENQHQKHRRISVPCECWRDWLATDNPYAIMDRLIMEAGAGGYMNLISVLAIRKP